MKWRDEHGAEELIRRAYPDLDPEEDGPSLAIRVFASAEQQMLEHERRLAQLATQRSQIEAAAELLRASKRELASARQDVRRDQFVNASVAAGLLLWTSYCLEWSGVPHPALGCILLVAAWATFYHYRGRRWLQGDR